MKKSKNIYLMMLLVAITCQAATVLPKIKVKVVADQALKTVPTYSYNLDPSLY